MSVNKKSLAIISFLIMLHFHCGYAQYMKEFVGPLSLVPPLDGELDRGKVEEDYRNKSGCLLCNRHLVLAGEHYMPFSAYDENSVLIDGIQLKIVEHLQKAYNFTWEVRRPLDGGWGHMYKNGSWSGKIGMVVNNEVDFAMGKHYLIAFKNCTITAISYDL